MTATIPSFEEYEHARWILDHPQDFDAAELSSAQQWATEFETAVRDAVAVRFESPRDLPSFVEGVKPFVMPGWDGLGPWIQDVLFDAAMVGARTAQGGAR
ncbi:hypothetical protein FK268_09380 [Tsukamurella sputi]|uniref:Uncharacterized protein n=1 Tax=Tsukamurella sputi TaxID=2591848 RepID=A0A5C5RT75_9ACTN|nr:hypothetical protein [Tsukamurella sputi]TWS25391.1 hypothetical protein FK268_09380 [Tsukamurella sputi]